MASESAEGRFENLNFVLRICFGFRYSDFGFQNAAAASTAQIVADSPLGIRAAPLN
jgi:hypothetical protein